MPPPYLQLVGRGSPSLRVESYLGKCTQVCTGDPVLALILPNSVLSAQFPQLDSQWEEERKHRVISGSHVFQYNAPKNLCFEGYPEKVQPLMKESVLHLPFDSCSLHPPQSLGTLEGKGISELSHFYATSFRLSALFKGSQLLLDLSCPNSSIPEGKVTLPLYRSDGCVGQQLEEPNTEVESIL